MGLSLGNNENIVCQVVSTSSEQGMVRLTIFKK